MQLVSDNIILMDILESSKRRGKDSATKEVSHLTIVSSKQDSVKMLKGILSSSGRVEEPTSGSRSIDDLKNILAKKESPSTPESIQKLKAVLNLANVQKASSGSGSTSPMSSASTARSDSSDLNSLVETPVKRRNSKSSKSPAKSTPSASPSGHKRAEKRMSSSPNTSNKFASSRLLASPDPTLLPLPDFDENFFA